VTQSTFTVTLPPGTCIANNDNLPDLPSKQWECLKDRLSVCIYFKCTTRLPA